MVNKICKITNNVGNRFKMYDPGIKLYSYCDNCSFLKFESLDDDDFDYLLRSL